MHFFKAQPKKLGLNFKSSTVFNRMIVVVIIQYQLYNLLKLGMTIFQSIFLRKLLAILRMPRYMHTDGRVNYSVAGHFTSKKSTHRPFKENLGVK